MKTHDGKRHPILTVQERLEVAAACKYVDEAIPNAPWIIDSDWIAHHQIDLVVHGDDYSQEELNFYYSVPIEMGIFRTIPYTHGISTTEIILRCKEADIGSKSLSKSRATWISWVARGVRGALDRLPDQVVRVTCALRSTETP